MKTLILKRTTSSEAGTFGMFLNAETLVPICLSLEKPWRFNEKEKSSIPLGVYVCKRIDSKKFSVADVPGRRGIQIEIFNREPESRGCIAPGTSFLREHGVVVGIGQSELAFGILNTHIVGDEFLLRVE